MLNEPIATESEQPLTRDNDTTTHRSKRPGVEVLRTLIAASGGLEIDNQSTGGGFERVLTTSDVPAAISATFSSTPIAVNGNVDAALSVNHGFTGDPDLVQLVLECTTGELGYSIGDQTVVNACVTGLDDTAGATRGTNLVAWDTTNIFFTLNSTDGGVIINDRLNPGLAAAITLTSWDVLVKAIQF